MVVTFSILSGEAAYLDYSNLPPWTVLYTIYPVYKLEPWVQVVWKNERSLDTLTNIVKSNHNEETKINDQEEILHDNESHQKSLSNKYNKEDRQSNYKHLVETQLWPIYFVSIALSFFNK